MYVYVHIYVSICIYRTTSVRDAGVVNAPFRAAANSALGAAVAKARSKIPPGAAGQCRALGPAPSSSCAYDPNDPLQRQLHAAELRIADQHVRLPALGIRLDLTNLSCHAAELCAVNTSSAAPPANAGFGAAAAPPCTTRDAKCGSARCPPATPWYSPASKLCHAAADWKAYYECCVAGGPTAAPTAGPTAAPTAAAPSATIGLQLEGLGLECSAQWALSSTGAPALAPPPCVPTQTPLRRPPRDGRGHPRPQLPRALEWHRHWHVTCVWELAAGTWGLRT
jgi:hypothetical protein